MFRRWRRVWSLPEGGKSLVLPSSALKGTHGPPVVLKLNVAATTSVSGKRTSQPPSRSTDREGDQTENSRVTSGQENGSAPTPRYPSRTRKGPIIVKCSLAPHASQSTLSTPSRSEGDRPSLNRSDRRDRPSLVTTPIAPASRSCSPLPQPMEREIGLDNMQPEVTLSSENSPARESRYPRRKRKDVSCRGCCGEDSHEDITFCPMCNSDHCGDCTVPETLTYIKDKFVSLGDPLRANKTLPARLSIRQSSLRGARHGVVALEPFPAQTCFGPLEGVRLSSVDKNADSRYTWELQHNGKRFFIDALPLDQSNWMRYVNLTPKEDRSNLVAFRRAGAIYFRARRPIRSGEELFVWRAAPPGAHLPSKPPAAAARRVEPASSGQKSGESQDDAAAAGLPVVFACKQCDDCYFTQELLDSHIQTQHPEKRPGKFECRFCQYSSNNRMHVVMHERTHTGERPHVCKLCRKGFMRREHLATHLRIHNGERPHACPECDQRFSDQANLSQHRRNIHLGPNAPAHVCRVCGRGFKRMPDLRTHMVVHAGVKPYSCATCDRQFAHATNLRKHRKRVHKTEYPLPCRHCRSRFATMCTLKRHVELMHGIKRVAQNASSSASAEEN